MSGTASSAGGSAGPGSAPAPRLRGRESSAGAGLEGQRRALAAACRWRGWRLLEAVEEEAGRPGKERPRPGAEQTPPLREHAEARALVAVKQIERAQALDELTSLLAAAHEQGWALVALDCAPETPAGEAVVDVRASLAPLERQLISERIKEALAAKRAQGVRLGRPPTISRYVIERIRRERAAGRSLAQIADGLNADRVPTAQGGQRWYPSTIRHTLNRRN